ncbi:hypothetical protein ECP02994385_5226 [Escherichia coli P0299438.5]|nr:hypothetical protein ECP029943811_5123 [Escherichia coli P0299438.11]ENB93396.1 hypothetical protein ECP02994383_5009 [Escherichia coli P0299438.3]ENC02213.1 hypothetical protein ECP02994385_5226 [Escherichia coli P0299438.5]ENC06560.1 hypothetical protein ECP02994386_5150 [Escherichia coli P0299438.6]ENC24575.1 hypothetical protein ECP02994387_5143 [Escherichia coli P0299438.7]ENC31240.1 hypothetical protein ECP02994388_5127 [Escherichia coli P0299438.8]
MGVHIYEHVSSRCKSTTGYSVRKRRLSTVWQILKFLRE